MSSVNLNTTSSLLTSADTTTKDKSAIAKELKQLEQDISSGDLTAAKQDYVTLKSELPDAASTTAAASATSTGSTSQTNPLDALFTQLGKDLDSGDLSAAKQDFSQIKDQFAKGPQGPPPGGPPPSSSTDSSTSATSSTSTTETAVEKLLKQLETSLNSGDTSTASTTLTTLQQEISAASTYSANGDTTGTAVDTYM